MDNEQFIIKFTMCTLQCFTFIFLITIVQLYLLPFLAVVYVNMPFIFMYNYVLNVPMTHCKVHRTVGFWTIIKIIIIIIIIKSTFSNEVYYFSLVTLPKRLNMSIFV
jgi:hypothetical protein